MMAKNPTVEELNNPDKFENVIELSHQEIRHFVMEQIRHDRFLIPIYMVYQVIMILFGTFFLTRSIVLAVKGFSEPLLWTIGSVVLSFTVLVIIHESLHGVALLLTGAKKISFGANLKNFMFFAEADHHVLNRGQFSFVAFTPFVVIKAISIYGIILLFNQPAVYFFIVLMSLHSLFCAGDIGLLSFFYSTQGELYVYDNKSEKKSYYFRKKE